MIELLFLVAQLTNWSVVALEDGYGVRAQGVLEALILESDVSQLEIISILAGDETRWF